MGMPINHHHVPQFLLSGWCRSDGRLAVYTRKGGRIVIDWHTPEHTAFEPHLYTISAVPQEDQQWVEREVMSRAVDDPAAKVLKRLQSGELVSLGSDERSAWARFIMAQWVRSPEMIANLRRDGRAALVRALEANPEEYEAIRGDAAHGTLLEWVDANARGLDEIVAMGRVLPKLINDDAAGTIIVKMLWQVLHLHGSKIDLLISDRPVVRFGSLDSRDCMITVPLSPRLLFVASQYDRGFTRMPPEKLARAANISTVREAQSRVYGSGVQHRPLAEKHLALKNYSTK